MRKRLRQGTAMILTAAMFLMGIPSQTLYAAQEQQEVSVEATTQEELSTENISENTEIDSEIMQQSMEESYEENTEGTSIQNQEVKQAELTDLLNYLVLDSSYIELGGTQNVVADIGDGAQEITQATLQYHRESDGQQFETASTAINGSGLRFTMQYGDSNTTGVYVLDSITYVKNGIQGVITLSDTGITARYGVGIEIESNADADIVDEGTGNSVDGDNVSLDVVSFDENGNQVSESSIQDAVEDRLDGTGQAKYNGNIVVVLDPGHDATHGGTHSASGLQEADLTLKIAQYCKTELQKYSGVTVYMTRDTSACPHPGTSSGEDNRLRVMYAKSVNADLFVSIHLNSGVTSKSGAEVYYPNANYNPSASAMGSSVASSILTQLVALGLNNRGTKVLTRDTSDNEADDFYPDGSAADYYGVIRNAKLQGITAIIVEHAFMTNTSDVNNYLSSEAQLQSLGIADATGIAQSLGLAKVGDYSAVFDATYYANHNADVKAVYGYDEAALLTHFITSGMAEGRQACTTFDVKAYRYANQDLRIAFGNDWTKYFMHYMQSGKNEGRVTTGVTSIQNPVTVYNGVDYSAVYNYSYYINKYADIKKAYGTEDDVAVLKHFVEFGMKEGRQGSSTFDVKSYRYAYSDLRLAYGEDYASYYMHYIRFGKAEGRTMTTGVSTVLNPITVYNGVNYAAVYNYSYYIGKYADVNKAYGNDDIAVLKHFVEFGMKEGRQGISTFDVWSYKNQYRDLRLTYGNDLKSYYLHYVSFGKNEGRIATGVSSVQNAINTYNGVDYSSVYNYTYYTSKYADVKAAYGNDDLAVLKHFVEFGMKEGRQGTGSFDVWSYKNMYRDLRVAYGNNFQAYYQHYLNFGKKEGRTASGVTTVQNAITTYNGVDYSAVYNYTYYTNKYADIKATYGNDDIAVLKHFVESGMREGRQASANFNVQVYKNNYVDLQSAYGNNLSYYYIHYINFGQKEGRIATDEYHTLLGANAVTVAQMVAYYNSVTSYPSAYSTSDAPNITAFCTLYYNECAAEGIDVAVAFSQAMLETNYLRFGGSVTQSQYNFAGMYNPTANAFYSFASVQIGIRAQIQHLKLYATPGMTTAKLANTCVDPKFYTSLAGKAPYVEWLSIPNNPNNTGWAEDANYASKVISIMNKVKSM